MIQSSNNLYPNANLGENDERNVPQDDHYFVTSFPNSTLVPLIRKPSSKGRNAAATSHQEAQETEKSMSLEKEQTQDSGLSISQEKAEANESFSVRENTETPKKNLSTSDLSPEQNGIEQGVLNQIKKLGWKDELVSFAPENLKNFPDETVQVIRGLWSGQDDVLLHNLGLKGWTIAPLRAVLVWDFERDQAVRALRENLRLVWTNSWNGIVEHDTYEHDPNHEPKWETLKLIDTNGQEQGRTTVVKRPGVHWVTDIQATPEDTNDKKFIERHLLALALKEARGNKLLAIIDTQNAEEKLRKGARWGTEWMAVRKKPGLFGKIAISKLNRRHSKGKKARRALFEKHSPFHGV